MGHTEFLVGKLSGGPSNLPEAIAGLEDASTLFCKNWGRGQNERAGAVSRDAMKLLDYIANELLREKVERLGLETYEGSVFQTAMAVPFGHGITDVTLADQRAMVIKGPGYGHVPDSCGRPIELALEKLLNKIKHRNSSLMNFRIEEGRHIFLICPEHTPGGAEGIYEFDVETFCELCMQASRAL